MVILSTVSVNAADPKPDTAAKPGAVPTKPCAPAKPGVDAKAPATAKPDAFAETHAAAEARVARGAEADARAAALFIALSTSKSPQERESIISSLHRLTISKSPEEHEAVGHYGANLSAATADPKKLANEVERRAVLARDIPILISSLTGDFQDKAWWILISIQPASFPAKKALWEKWWRETGKAIYEAEAAPAAK